METFFTIKTTHLPNFESPHMLHRAEFSFPKTWAQFVHGQFQWLAVCGPGVKWHGSVKNLSASASIFLRRISSGDFPFSALSREAKYIGELDQWCNKLLHQSVNSARGARFPGKNRLSRQKNLNLLSDKQCAAQDGWQNDFWRKCAHVSFFMRIF